MERQYVRQSKLRVICGRLLWSLVAAWPPLAGAGCAQFRPVACMHAPVIRAASAEETDTAVHVDQSKGVTRPECSEGRGPARSTPFEDSGRATQQLAQTATGLEAPAQTVVPIGLDTVFRLAEEHNPLIGVAREKINEAYAEKRLAELRCIPDVYAGTAFYRHEGGIQSFEGPLIRSSTGALFSGAEINSQLDLRDYAFQKLNAQRQVWQQKGELSRVTSETLLEAANAYIDLLTALSGEAVAREIEKQLRELLDNAERLANTEPGAQVEVARIKAELRGQQQVFIRVHSQVEAASAKLIYHLGIDPCSTLVPVDPKIVPIDLVDAAPAASELVQQALLTGPGIQEMEGLLSLIHEGIARAQGPASYLPIFGVRLAEGGFGAGAGASLAWDNRFDLGLQARWNLTEYVTRRERRIAAQSKVAQLQLAHQELRNKLSAGVQEARISSLSGLEQIQLGEEQIAYARRTHQLSQERWKNNVPNSSLTEVLLALRGVGLAQAAYLTAVNSYDKAQIRLLLLLGAPARTGKGVSCPNDTAVKSRNHTSR